MCQTQTIVYRGCGHSVTHRDSCRTHNAAVAARHCRANDPCFAGQGSRRTDVDPTDCISSSTYSKQVKKRALKPTLGNRRETPEQRRERWGFGDDW